jgi:uncharacterized membrane protein YccF (DUF307 family)
MRPADDPAGQIRRDFGEDLLRTSEALPVGHLRPLRGGGTMTLVGNVIWLVCGGLMSGLAHIVAGVVLCLTVIGIPFGYQEIKLGIATLAPFGCELVENEDANSPLWLVLNVIWLLTFGWVIALHHLLWAVLLALTVVGLPFALQHLKLIPLALLPFGRDLVRDGWRGDAARNYESHWNQAVPARR